MSRSWPICTPTGGVAGCRSEGQKVADAGGVQSIHVDVQPIEHQLHVGVDVPVDAESPDVLNAAANGVRGRGRAGRDRSESPDRGANSAAPVPTRRARLPTRTVRTGAAPGTRRLRRRSDAFRLSGSSFPARRGHRTSDRAAPQWQRCGRHRSGNSRLAGTSSSSSLRPRGRRRMPNRRRSSRCRSAACCRREFPAGRGIARRGVDRLQLSIPGRAAGTPTCPTVRRGRCSRRDVASSVPKRPTAASCESNTSASLTVRVVSVSALIQRAPLPRRPRPMRPSAPPSVRDNSEGAARSMNSELSTLMPSSMLAGGENAPTWIVNGAKPV